MKLYSQLSESFNHNRNEHVLNKNKKPISKKSHWANPTTHDVTGSKANLDKPSEEENKREEVDVGFPELESVQGFVHGQNPAFLGRTFVHSEYTEHEVVKPTVIPLVPSENIEK